MNRDDVIRWATQCKMPYDFVTGEIVQIEKLERFAALVAAAAKSEENEACAKLLESRRSGANELMDATREMEAYAIRARGQK